MRPVPAACLDLLREYEKGPDGDFAATPYMDEGRLCTGWGHNIFSPDDPLITEVLTRARANQIALSDLASVARRLEAVLGDLVVCRLTDGQWSALIDFAFNEGIGRFEGSTMLTKIRAGDLAAAAEFPRWVYCRNKAGEEVTNGRLAERRAAERALWEGR